MSVSRIVAALALLVGILTLLRATSCSAGMELLVGVGVTATLAAVWNDNPKRDVAARIAKFLVLLFVVGTAVFFMALLLNASACPPRR